MRPKTVCIVCDKCGPLEVMNFRYPQCPNCGGPVTQKNAIMNRTQRFLKRLRDELEIDVPEDAYVTRTRAGYWQRSAGAWTSFFRSPTVPLFEIGIWRPIAELLRCPTLEVFDMYGLSVECGCKGGCKGLKKSNKDLKPTNPADVKCANRFAFECSEAEQTCSADCKDRKAG